MYVCMYHNLLTCPWIDILTFFFLLALINSAAMDMYIHELIFSYFEYT
jgi:hypothetical protein